MSIDIRVARTGELSVIQELNYGSFENDLEHDPHLVMTWPYDPETGAAYFKSRLEGAERSVCFVAEQDNQIVGYLAGAMKPIESYRNGSRSELENMFVKPSARRQSVGSSLVDAFRKWSIDQGADEVYVSAYFENSRAVSFYMSNGFNSYAHDLLLDLRDGNDD